MGISGLPAELATKRPGNGPNRVLKPGFGTARRDGANGGVQNFIFESRKFENRDFQVRDLAEGLRQ